MRKGPDIRLHPVETYRSIENQPEFDWGLRVRSGTSVARLNFAKRFVPVLDGLPNGAAATVARSRDAMHADGLEKQHIIEKIVASLRQEFEGSMRSARAAHAEATHEQSKAENKYDTRGLEASYLARGQSRQAAELLRTIQLFENLSSSELALDEPISVGALVELEQDGERTFYFIGPGGGGTEVECDGQNVLVLTPQSPMGQQLVGHKTGTRLEIRVGRNVEIYQILSAK